MSYVKEHGKTFTDNFSRVWDELDPRTKEVRGVSLDSFRGNLIRLNVM